MRGMIEWIYAEPSTFSVVNRGPFFWSAGTSRRDTMWRERAARSSGSWTPVRAISVESRVKNPCEDIIAEAEVDAFVGNDLQQSLDLGMIAEPRSIELVLNKRLQGAAPDQGPVVSDPFGLFMFFEDDESAHGDRYDDCDE